MTLHIVAQLLGHKDLRMVASYQHLSPCGSGRALGRRAHYFLNVLAPAIFEYSELPAEL